MPRYVKNLALLVKVETAYGNDPNPTAAANALLAANVDFNPSAGDVAERDLVTGRMGHQGVLLVGTYATISYDIELAGAGAAGSPAPCGPCLRACGMDQILAAGVDAQYQFMDGTPDAVTHYFNDDGVNYVLLGCRGTFTLNLTPKQIPRIRFTFTGLLGTFSDVSRPNAVYTGFQKPVEVSKANTTLSLHAYTGPCESFTLDAGLQIEPRFLIGYEGIERVDRKMTGNAVLEATLLATKNWFTASRNQVVGALAIQHGTQAGNIVQLSADAVQIGRPTRGSTQGIINTGLPLMMTTQGAVEFKLTVK